MVIPQEGEVYDRRGVPIYRGDLVRSPHFRDRRRHQHWLYHVAVLRKAGLYMVPPQYMDFTCTDSGGSYWLCDGSDLEVIQGHGPGDILDFNDRPKRKAQTNEAR